MPDVVIVGGGLAGSAAAIVLARAGRSVVLLERTLGRHNKVCGEFLSAEALHYLQRLGVDPRQLGAVGITTLRVSRASRTTEQALPFDAMSLTRRVLDEALLQQAQQAGCTVRRGLAVQSLTPTATGWMACTGDGGTFVAPTAVLATGKHDLPGHPRTHPLARSVWRHDGLLALNQYFQLAPAQAQSLRHAVEVTLFRGGYCGLQLVEDGTANLGLLVEQGRFRQLGNSWPNLLDGVCREAQLLQQRLAGATQLLPKPLALAHIPYGFRRAAAADGLWSVGDQAAVIPSFSGDGMSIALHSGILAAESILAGERSSAFQRRLAGQLRTPVSLATLVSRAMVRTPALSAMVPARALRSLALHTRVPLCSLATPLHSGGTPS